MKVGGGGLDLLLRFSLLFSSFFPPFSSPLFSSPFSPLLVILVLLTHDYRHTFLLEDHTLLEDLIEPRTSYSSSPRSSYQLRTPSPGIVAAACSDDASRPGRRHVADTFPEFSARLRNSSLSNSSHRHWSRRCPRDSPAAWAAPSKTGAASTSGRLPRYSHLGYPASRRPGPPARGRSPS